MGYATPGSGWMWLASPCLPTPGPPRFPSMLPTPTPHCHTWDPYFVIIPSKGTNQISALTRLLPLSLLYRNSGVVGFHPFDVYISILQGPRPVVRAIKESGVLTNMYLRFTFINSFVQTNLLRTLCDLGNVIRQTWCLPSRCL